MARDLYEVVGDAEERAVLVGIDRARSDGWTLDDDLAELRRLVDTAGAVVAGVVTQRMDRPNPRTFIGSGKAEEVERIACEAGATMVVFDDDLSPSQQANLEGLLPQVRVIDRTQLILDIFALHAVSHEGKLQVELARLEYVLPRLRGMWGHLEAERLGGGRGARFGAGESQLESDRRLTRKRISELKRELKHVARARATQRASRARSGVFRIALVGYTNAGKSTLLNALTDAGVLAQDQLFATLDATTRRLDLPDGRTVTLTDTVGFINKLPHGLVEAFKSTLDEVREADLLL
ncbi:MAG TPA: GTPase HflX, partial [Actinobacteria bacterium]|nr:GTPase HflX [Actinomycetota bacterium]